MDRRYVCNECGTKWFIPASDRFRPDPSECGACGGQLTTFAGPTEHGRFPHDPEPADQDG